jgi:hypothetical protein
MKVFLTAAIAVFLLLEVPAYAEPEADTIVCRQGEFVMNSIPEALKKDYEHEMAGETEDGGDTAYFLLTDQLIAEGLCYETNRVDVVFVEETKYTWCLNEDGTACLDIGEAFAKLPPEAGGGFMQGWAISRTPEGDLGKIISVKEEP